MAYIPLDESIPGIRSLLAYFPAIEPAMKGLMQTMMRQDQGLNKGERELIAAWVSHQNHCTACENIHGAVASHLLGWDEADYASLMKEKAGASPRLEALLVLARQVTWNGKKVTPEQIAKAKALGCTDQEVHDTLLIASMFCMFNRYIDGLGLTSRDTPDSLKTRAQHLAEYGYGT
jgi:uncharacterized peroxidase-related enzyme